MNYILALLLPPLSVLFIGRIFTAIFMFVVWAPALIFTLGGAHPFFILIAWLLIYERNADRRARERA
jgi:hypothetical protein